jgi:hypothetical protein
MSFLQSSVLVVAMEAAGVLHDTDQLTQLLCKFPVRATLRRIELEC